MNTIAHFTETVQRIVGEEAEQLAREVGFIQRERVLSGADFVQTLIWGWLARTGDHAGRADASTTTAGDQHHGRWPLAALHAGSRRLAAAGAGATERRADGG